MTKKEFEECELIQEAIQRGIIEIKSERVTYNLNKKKSYSWSDPEEWVRAKAVAFLTLKKSYAPNCIRTEVTVPRRTPEDLADIVVYEDNKCQNPYLVVETKKEKISERQRKQAIEQLFGNANSLRIPLALYENNEESILYDVLNFPSTERNENIKGNRDAVPEQYGKIPEYTFIAGPGNNDIIPATKNQLELKVKRAHSIIWAGGKRDPLLSFDEWSKIMFAKVEDERNTPNNTPRRFQVGTNETDIKVANRVHELFRIACRADATIFKDNVDIELPDKKIVDVVRCLQDISITDTDVDNIGKAFEVFFGGVFRGELGQYFTMRPLARFAVAMLDINQDDYVIDITCGSGGFLLEVLLQVWNRIDKDFAGRNELARIKNDFALHKVYGIEIHEILARICKINLLLHHDGHTNIEGDRSCLETEFSKPRLNNFRDAFDIVVGNLPFGDTIIEGDEDQLGNNSLENFVLSKGKDKIASEHIMIERAIEFLAPGGKFAIVLPDGIFNNQGENSNCPLVRRYLVKNGFIKAVVSLPDHAFRKSGAQNKTSILFFQKFTREEKEKFDEWYWDSVNEQTQEQENFDAINIPLNVEEIAIDVALEKMNYQIFMAEANYIGYNSVGNLIINNDLYKGAIGGHLDDDQANTILGEFRRFETESNYQPETTNCIALSICKVWREHVSHRIDPKYHLFVNNEQHDKPNGWKHKKVCELMERRLEIVKPEEKPDEEVIVMTLKQTGDIIPREAGKGKNPPEWLGMYFEDSASTWYKAYKGDLVYSSIDMWKGCISVVPNEFDGALVTKEFPIYKMKSNDILPDFLALLLRSRYYQKAFKAITTGHSNRRRTQSQDFESIEIWYPEDKKVQEELMKDYLAAKNECYESTAKIKKELYRFSNYLDGLGEMEYEIASEDLDNEV